MKNIINYSKHYIDKKDVFEVSKVLKSNFLTQGPTVKKFEDKIKKYLNVKFSIAVNSATSGLHISCLALGVKKGDIVWTTPNSFVATANCIIHCGAKVDFVDINPDTYNICANLLEKKLKKTKKKKLPKVIIVVHFSGLPCDLNKIKKLSKKYKFKIIEDSSHALGANYRKTKIGDCKFSDISVFSFHPIKSITSGEGGMVTTNSKEISNKLSILRSHGILRNKKIFEKKYRIETHYDQVKLGFNFRMNDIEAALGISQFKKLKKFLKRRKEIADFYFKNLNKLPIKLPINSKDSSWHLFVILLKNFNIRNKLYKYLKKRGIICQLHYIPIHTHSYYKEKKFNTRDFPNSVEYYKTCISLPMFYSLKNRQLNKIVSLIKKFYAN
ncbi:UDP-4-amino-4,6-dideoxy-N-acetyl-beta-L-altrosamine transaminase [Candidatus Pelagibacter sp. HIMB1483]|uniref:UDP-4-amino-4, 6-dideoxy-N-acetyl-beta-L-altrosamine transaminase n=1 Tax=Candidatus Pelagibacter sp. HIMB1483 TaxID=3415414 RepID=UPI003F83EB4E